MCPTDGPTQSKLLTSCDSVDHKTDKLMQDIIRKEFEGCTIIAVAHRLDTIADFDRVAVLDEGSICEIGHPQALLATNSRFRSMWSGNQSE